MAKGMDIEMAPFDEDHVRAKITWSEQDVGGGKLVVEVGCTRSSGTCHTPAMKVASCAICLARQKQEERSLCL